MTKFSVSETDSKLHIAIDDVGTGQAEVLKALQDCAEGNCSCPTSQYEKLQSVEIAPVADGVAVTLTPKAGETIDRQAIDRCLEYTAGQLTGKG